MNLQSNLVHSIDPMQSEAAKADCRPSLPVASFAAGKTRPAFYPRFVTSDASKGVRPRF